MNDSVQELAGTVCAVTGGGRGIGAAIGALFAQHGARIAVLDRDERSGCDTAQRLRDTGTDARFYGVDVTDETSVESAAKRVSDDFGRVDVLVNNAGISRLGPSMEFSLAEWNESLAVLMTGVFLCSREFGKHFRSAGRGTIVNISSVNGIASFPQRLAYSAAKAAVLSMTKVLAVEWAQFGIRVNAVAPGMTHTEMVQEAIDQGLIDPSEFTAALPLGRIAEPREIAEAVLFLVSDRSSYLTGQVIVPDGGWTAFGGLPPGILKFGTDVGE